MIIFEPGGNTVGDLFTVEGQVFFFVVDDDVVKYEDMLNVIISNQASFVTSKHNDFLVRTRGLIALGGSWCMMHSWCL